MSNTLKHSGRWYVQGIYKDVLHDPRISIAAKGMFTAMMAFVSSDSPCPFPSLDHLGRILNINPRTAQNYIDELVKVGLLEKEQQWNNGRFGSNAYTLYDAFPENRVENAIRDTKPARNTDVPKTDICNADASPANVSKHDDKGIPTVKGKPEGQEVKATTTTFADAKGGGSGAVTNPGKDPTLEPVSEQAEEAAIFKKGWVNLIGKIKGHRIVIAQDTDQRIQDWFERHPQWTALELVWVAFQAMLKAENNPRPKGLHDPYLYCRFAHGPQWFMPNKKDGVCKVFETTMEVGYHRDLDLDEIQKRMSNYLASLDASS
jgi:hypothetical protein